MEHENDPYCGQKPFNGHTALPWNVGGEVNERIATLEEQHNIYPQPGELGPVAEVSGKDNAEFITHLGNTYYPTRAALQAAEGRVKELEKALEALCNMMDRIPHFDRGYMEGLGNPGEATSWYKRSRALLSAKEDKP